MELSSFDIEQIINSLDDRDWDLKPFVCENIAICGSHEIGVNESEADLMNYQIPTARASSSSQLISFGSSTSPILDYDKLSATEKMVYNIDKMRTATRDRGQYHAVAERKRRAKLTQHFIALSKIVPGLKKLDKASLLGDAINYMKELQERLRVLEEAPETNTSGSNGLDPPEKVFSNTEDHGSDGRAIRNPIQEIKVRISSSSTMLIKIQCDKEHRLVQQIVEEMGKLHLTVSDFRVIPFGCHTLDVTILAQIDSGFCCAVKDVTKQLEMAVLNPHYLPNKQIK